MLLTDLENAIINSFIHYDITYLKSIDSNGIYSFNSKKEFIAEIKQEIDKLKKDYPEGLYIKKSLCKFCYPCSTTYSLDHYQADLS